MSEELNSQWIQDGGPAFPVECQFDAEQVRGLQTGNTSGWATGMSLRDYFAANAMAGLASDWNEERKQGFIKQPHWGDSEAVQGSVEVRAFIAYRFADAMLAERGKGGEA